MCSAASEPSRVAIRVPDLGTGAHALQLVQWLVDPGSPLMAGDRVAEVLATGILFQLPAPVSGTILRIEKPDRSEVRVGDIIGWIECGPQQ